jgi:hypothetical protein
MFLHVIHGRTFFGHCRLGEKNFTPCDPAPESRSRFPGKDRETVASSAGTNDYCAAVPFLLP